MHLSYLHAPAVAALLHDRKVIAPKARLDSADSSETADAASDHVEADLALRAANTVQQWAETEDDDLGEDEGLADRLWGMLVGVANDGADGELTDDEQAIVGATANQAWDYLSAKGASDEDLDAMFNSDDPASANEAATRVREFVAAKLPDGDEAAADEADDFAFADDGEDDQSSIYDSVKRGKVSKRISGAVRLSGKQKVAVRKAHMKSHGASAMAKRMKSLRVSK